METKERVRKPQQRKKRSDVVYLPPKPLGRNRLLLHLLSIAAIVLALIIGVSLFFKVGEIRVSGNEKYSAWDISQAAGIQEGDNLITLSRARISGKIISALPYVKSARIGIKLPSTVNIYVEEVEVTYAVADESGSWWMLSSDGRVVEKAITGEESDRTKLLGVKLTKPGVGEQAVALEDLPPKVDSDGNALPQTVTKADYLNTLLEVAQTLELNGIIGKIAVVDVSQLDKIELWYGSRFRIFLGDNSQLGYKISYMKAAVEKMSGYQSGTLDVSFTTWTDKAEFIPFGDGK